MRKLISLLILVSSIHIGGYSQSIGLVLSGGGADALAHIGVIKALEENNIPIDYITGTSMGALVGAMYASGIPIKDIEEYFTSDYFYNISKGEIPKKFHYYYPVLEDKPIIIPIRFKKTSNGYNMLFPSKVISSEAIDIEVVKHLALPEKLAGYTFDSLHIPFRCVAADVVTKELVTFKDGSLTEALRASMSYPFFIRPIKIDGHLMYDGGIYNNFPVDIMCTDFNPDYIIGSNVSQNISEPDQDDLFSQLQNILVRKTNYGIYCKEGELIEPNTNAGTFNFEDAQSTIDSGYVATIRHIQHIKYHVPKTESSHTLKKEDKVEMSDQEIIIGEIIFKGVNEKQARYAGSVLRQNKKKEKFLNFKTFERNYYRLYQQSYVEDIYSKLVYNEKTDKYDAIVQLTPIKSITLNLGGNFATRPISEGFAELSFNNLSTYGTQFGVSTYFGKLYQALNVNARFDFPSRMPIYIKPKMIIHNWNWFESRQANLFVDDKPNYVIEGELYTGLEIGTGISNKLKLTAEINYLQMESKYYQTKSFTPTDTADATRFNGLVVKGSLSTNSLNYKQYAYEGNSFNLEASYTYGNEFYSPGSTSPQMENTNTTHGFLLLKFDYQTFVKLHEKVRFGITVSGAYSNMTLFSNYTSTVIQSAYFKPTPDSRTLFLESFHANKFGAIGGQLVILPLKKFQVRAEGYIFQPYQSYVVNENNEVAYGSPFNDRFAIVSGVISYQTPLGPLSFSVNYYYNNPDISPEDEAPITALLNFGYILFNKRAYH